MLNLDLMKNPLNWIIIVLMVTIGALAVQSIFLSADTDPAS